MTLERLVAAFSSTNANCLLDRHDKDLAVPDLSGTCRLYDGFNGGLNHLGGHDHLDTNFWQKINNVFSAAIQFGMAFLSAKAFAFGEGRAPEPVSAGAFPNFAMLEGMVV